MYEPCDSYPTGIVCWKRNKVFSATLASLIHLGAFDLCILEEDRHALRDECSNHFSEDYNDKIKVLGPVPTTTLKAMKQVSICHDDGNMVD